VPGAEVTYLAREVGWDKPLGIVCDTDSGWSGRIEEDARALGSGLVRSRVIYRRQKSCVVSPIIAECVEADRVASSVMAQ